MKVAWDIESNGLLNDSTIDYSSVPYRLKRNFVMHCITAIVDGRVFCFHDGDKIILDGREHVVVKDGIEYRLNAGYEPIEYVHRPLSAFPKFVEWIEEGSTIIAHNQINYDLLAVKLYYGIDYAVEVDMSVGAEYGDDYWAGKKVVFDDTLVRSKTLNPDRFGGHSLDNLSKHSEDKKMEFRHNLPALQRFEHFAPDMLYYNICDVKANLQVADALDAEMLNYDWGDKWKSAIKLEKAVAELITRQEHRGFKFDSALAKTCIEELDSFMEERRVKIEAILPEKPATKGFMKDFIPPKIQFKKNGEPSSNLIKFAEKIGAYLDVDASTLTFNGREYTLPIDQEPLVTTSKASVNDTTFIKEWLVGLGWRPLEYKEKDLTVDTKKLKLSPDKLAAAVSRYIEQTSESNFAQDRLEHLGVSLGKDSSPERIRQLLATELNKRLRKKGGIKVLTNPSFTVGQEKEICKNLLRLAEENEKYACILDIVEYLTYRHRRNSILGGGADWDEDEEPQKGYLSAVRVDGRIPTPADTCGAATSRMKHRLVANIPRVASLYGGNMRALFGVDDDCYQIGYDFDSLEAREEANFCWQYEDGAEKEYCQSLLMDKPNDVHCYSEDTEILTEQGWRTFGELYDGVKVAQWVDGTIQYVVPEAIVWQDYKGRMISIENGAVSQLITPNHRMLLKGRRGGYKVRFAEDVVRLRSQYQMPACGVAESDDSLIIRLAVATQADGHLNKDSSAITFVFTKQRKVLRMQWLLDRLGASYNMSVYSRNGRDETSIRVNAGEICKSVRGLLTKDKALVADVCLKHSKAVVDEAAIWDGTVRNNGDIIIDTTCHRSRDVIQACATASGFKCSAKTYTKETTYGTCTIYRAYISVNSKVVSFKSSADVKEIHYEGKIGCVAVPSSFVVVRRDGKVCVSGNTKMAQKISEILGREFGRAPAKSVKYGLTN